MEEIYYIGYLELQDKVDITDPCYDRDTWCRMTTDCKAGTYYGFVKEVDCGDWGKRIAQISISQKHKFSDITGMECIGSIGVDAGLAGFFNNKPDYDREEWRNFCDVVDFSKEVQAWDIGYGLFSSSGYGDGGYNVYANQDRTAFTIVFIGDDELLEEDDL